LNNGRVTSAPSVDLIVNNLSLFAQDNWHATSRMVVTYGVRWEFDPAPSFANGISPVIVVGLDNPATVSVAPMGTPLYHTTYGNFAPRLGFAYKLREIPNSTLVVRGGFGVFYDLGNTPVGSVFAGPPFLGTRSLANTIVPLSAALTAAPVPSTSPPFANVSAIHPNLRLHYTWQWNLSLEQGLGPYQTVTVSYVGAAGRRLLGSVLLPAPNANFSTSVGFTDNLPTSDYDALQLQFQRRLAKGIQALASYT